MDDWRERAACLGMDTDVFFPGRGRNNARAALAVCYQCPVQQQCADHALTEPENFGIWGATTPDDRKRMVTSWA